MRSAVSFGIKCIGFLLLWGLLATAAIPLGDTAQFLTGSRAWTQLCRDAVPLLAAGLVTLLLTRISLPAEGIRTQIGVRPGDGIWMGAGVGTCWAAGTLALFWITGTLHFVRQTFRLDEMSVWIAALLCGVLTQGLLAHGLLYTGLERQFSPNAALLGTASLFLILHFPIWRYGPLAFCNLLAMGILLSLLRRYSGGILAPMAAHFTWDFAAGFLFSGTPSENYPSLIQISLKGSWWITGSSAGMMGSVLTLVATLTMTFLLVLAVSRKRRKNR